MVKQIITTLLLTLTMLFAQDKTAPEFRLKNLSGKNIDSKLSSRKEVVVLNFWASFCAPCKEEMPEFEELNREYKGKGLAIFAISTDKGSGVKQASSYAKTQAFTFEILFDEDNVIYKKYGGKGVLPLTVIVNKEGKIVYERTGKINRKTLENEFIKHL